MENHPLWKTCGNHLFTSNFPSSVSCVIEFVFSLHPPCLCGIYLPLCSSLFCNIFYFRKHLCFSLCSLHWPISQPLPICQHDCFIKVIPTSLVSFFTHHSSLSLTFFQAHPCSSTGQFFFQALPST